VKKEFQISYTLDVLCYINCMINEDKKKLYEEDIERFMPMLGTVSDKYLHKLEKLNEKNPNFIVHIVAILVDNHHLHNWTTADLFSQFKSLIGEFKRSNHFKHAGSELKKFLSADFSKSMGYIKVITTDLERLGFKKFWLEEKLPVLKERIAEYETRLDQFDIKAHIDNWMVERSQLSEDHWYVLSFSGDDFDVLLKHFNVVSPVVSAIDLFEKMISYALRQQDYRGMLRKFKPSALLKNEFKMHAKRRTYRKLSVYIESCLRMAKRIYLVETTPESAEVTLVDDYPFASDVLEYLRTHEKGIEMPVSDYIIEMVKHFSR